MIIENIKLKPTDQEKELIKIIAKKAGISYALAGQYKILKKSLDARKNQVYYNYKVLLGEDKASIGGVEKLVLEDQKIAQELVKKTKTRPLIIGFGPAGIFAALYLALRGENPIIIEQGETAAQRRMTIEKFWQEGKLDEDSNVQFGEGGAGTFSDGKLNSNLKNKDCVAVLEEFFLAGAPEEILYLNKPHIGTDLLQPILIKIRKKIEAYGGEFYFSTKVERILYKDGCIKGVEASQKDKITQKKQLKIFNATQVVFAIGHSARNFLAYLATEKIPMESKPFAMGLRVEHLQKQINKIQYGDYWASQDILPAADYKMAVHLPTGRSVYTFCMCPGGEVVAATSEKNSVVTNGMSFHKRAGLYANSALLVEIKPKDLAGADILAGVKLQQKLEQEAFTLGGGNYRAPAESLASFMGWSKRNEFGKVIPSYSCGCTAIDLAKLLPEYMASAIREALPLFDQKMKGFMDEAAVFTAIESRSSSPVRILRNDTCQSPGMVGFFPCGEGAGYAGGIMSAALDGLRVAKAVAKGK